MITIHPSGQEDRAIVLDGEPGYSNVWRLSRESLKAWYGLPGSKRGVFDAAGRHGGLGARSWRQPRGFTLEGWADLSAPEAGQPLINALSSLHASDLSRPVVVTVTDRDGVKRWRRAILRGVDIDASETMSLTYAIDCEAPDIRRYALPAQGGVEPFASSATDFNLVPNPGLESSTAGWFASTGPGTRREPLTPADSTAGAGQAGQWTVTAEAPSLSIGIVVPLPQAPQYATVQASPSRDATLHLTITWLNTEGRILAVDKLADQQTTGGQWITLSGPVTPPAGAASAWLVVDGADTGTWAVGSSLSVDRALLGNSTGGAYRDGDSPGWTWVGTPGLSPSRKAGAMWEFDNSEGTAPSPAIITVTVAETLTTGLTLRRHATGETLNIPGPIKTGATLEILPEDRCVLLNGGLLSQQPIGWWPVAQPGESLTVTLSAGEGAATARATFYPAWW
nr:MAG TPA: tail protein [Caudoviricetes sp.]